MHPHQRHRRGRQDRPPRHVLPDERQLLASATTSRRGRSATPGSCSPPRERGRPRLRRSATCGSRSTRTTTRRSRSGRSVAGLPDERIQRLGKEDNYWSHRAARSRRSVLRDLLRPRSQPTASTAAPRPTTTRVHRDLEPRLHAVPDRRREVEDRLPHRRRAAEEEHRHRHGHGARRVHQAGRRQHVRDRPGAAGARPRRRALRPRYGADHEDDVRMRVIADHVRSEPHAHDRRRHAERTRAAATSCARLHAPQRSARCGCSASRRRRSPSCSPRARDAMKAAYPEVAASTERIERARASAEEDSFLAHARAAARTILGCRGREGQGGGGTGQLPGDTTVPPARHLRLPDRPHPRDRRGGGAQRSTARRSTRLMPAQRTAREGRRRRRRRAQLADLSRVRRLPRARARRSSPATTSSRRETPVLGILVDGRLGAIAPRRGRSPRSSSPRPRSTRSPVARRPTRGCDRRRRLRPRGARRAEAGQGPHQPHRAGAPGEVAVGDAGDERGRRRCTGTRRRRRTRRPTSCTRPSGRRSAARRTSRARSTRPATCGSTSPGTRRSRPRRAAEIEEIANNAVRDNLEVDDAHPAARRGARRPARWRCSARSTATRCAMVDIGGPWSRELCAGIHVRSSAEVGLVNLVGESSGRLDATAASRRSSASTPSATVAAERAIVSQLDASTSKTPREQLPDRIASLVDAAQGGREEDRRVRGSEALGPRAGAGRERDAGSAPTEPSSRTSASWLSADELRSLATSVRGAARTPPPAVVDARGRVGHSRQVASSSPRNAGRAGRRRQGRRASRRAPRRALGGGGGGKDDLAQGGGSDVGGDRPRRLRQDHARRLEQGPWI